MCHLVPIHDEGRSKSASLAGVVIISFYLAGALHHCGKEKDPHAREGDIQSTRAPIAERIEASQTVQSPESIHELQA